MTAELFTRMAIPDTARETLAAVRQAQPDLARFIETGFSFSNVPAHTCLLRAGDVPDTCHFVLSGLVRAFHPGHGTEVTTHFMPEGFVLTSVHACLGRHAVDENFETVENCVIAVLNNSFQLFHNPAKEMPKQALWLMNQYFTQLGHRIRILECGTKEEKLDCFNRLYPGLLRRAPLIHTASYLGVSIKWLKKNALHE